MSRWFRFYADAMRHPKVAKLNDAQFRLWVELLAVAADRDGIIPPLEDLKHVLRRRLDHLSRGVKELVTASLIDPLGDGYTPHGWDKRQYKSDTSTDRVRKYRGKGNVSETPPDTEAETETELATNVACPTSSEVGQVIELFQPDEVPSNVLTPEHVRDEWNLIADKLGKPKIRALTPERRQAVKARIKGYSLEDWFAVMGAIERSPFLRGDTGWHGCTFDWVMKKGNFQKILEGNYDDKPVSQSRR